MSSTGTCFFCVRCFKCSLTIITHNWRILSKQSNCRQRDLEQLQLCSTLQSEQLQDTACIRLRCWQQKSVFTQGRYGEKKNKKGKKRKQNKNLQTQSWNILNEVRGRKRYDIPWDSSYPNKTNSLPGLETWSSCFPTISFQRPGVKATATKKAAFTNTEA